MTDNHKVSGAFRRAKRRWTPWRILVVPLALGCTFATCVVLARITLWLQTLLSPRDAFFCTPTRLSLIILFFVLIPVQLAWVALLLMCCFGLYRGFAMP